MKLYIVTSNKHKVQEAKAVFSEFGIDIEQIDDEKVETKEMDIYQTAEYNAKMFFGKYRKPVIVDDTGVFFGAYDKFPGNHPKLMFELLGYKGLLKLLEGERRDAKFITAVSYCSKDGMRTFTGELDCTVDTRIHDLEKDVLPYERILLVDGRPVSKMSLDEKNRVSHRAKAFRKLAESLLSN